MVKFLPFFCSHEAGSSAFGNSLARRQRRRECNERVCILREVNTVPGSMEENVSNYWRARRAEKSINAPSRICFSFFLHCTSLVRKYNSSPSTSCVDVQKRPEGNMDECVVAIALPSCILKW
jgi:hypothetical protein